MTEAIRRRASCSCGQASVTCEGDPVRVSMCHCHACQRRTGSVFGVQARWPAASVQLEGTWSTYVRTGDSGGVATFSFCPRCGTTVHWSIDRQPELVAIAVGAFADSDFPAPSISIYESRRPAWVAVPADLEHWD